MEPAAKKDDNGSGRSGRWTKAEHEQFLQGLREYGKDWKRIGALITTRTVVQVRTHAQKYFLAHKKLESEQDPSSSFQKDQAKKRNVPSKSKSKKKKEDFQEDPQISLGSDFLDAWSSGSDAGSPTSLDETELLKAPLPAHTPPLQHHLDVSINPISSISSPPPADDEDDLMIPEEAINMETIKAEGNQFPNPSQPLTTTTVSEGAVLMDPFHSGVTITSSRGPAPQSHHHDDHDFTKYDGLDPLPPSLEMVLLGKWMDTMTE